MCPHSHQRGCTSLREIEKTNLQLISTIRADSFLNLTAIRSHDVTMTALIGLVLRLSLSSK